MTQESPVTHIISLLPLDAEYHTAALQAVYAAAPRYWAMYGLAGPPPDQAAQDLASANDTPGRYMLGIVTRVDPQHAEAGAELIGVLDFRLHWPQEGVATIGMLLVAEPYQRQGVGGQAWALLAPWLAATAGVSRARLALEQFNFGALKFWEAQGFTLTGESDRVRQRDQFVRLLYLDQTLAVD
jgi:RimJ/RimL family protein N-acetyltransferase